MRHAAFAASPRWNHDDALSDEGWPGGRCQNAPTDAGAALLTASDLCSITSLI